VTSVSPTTGPLPTGDQHTITLGDATATIASVAASLRSFSIGGVDVTTPYPEDVTPPFGDGIVLVPWPNRVDRGAWTLDGEPQQLDLTEPDRDNAIHGLLRYTAYDLVERTESSVTLGATVWPQHGYPFLLETTVRYALIEIEGGHELEVTHTITNRSAAKAPAAIGTHPFFTIGDVQPEELVLTLHAATRIEVDDRLIPTGTTAVEGTTYDLRAGRLLADLDLDHAFADLSPVDGVVASLRCMDGREVRLVQDEQHHWVQIFTTRKFPGTSLAVAIEPMTAPPNALVTGEGLRWVEPGETWTTRWGIQASF
jgi:aldose 1-epimerase